MATPNGAEASYYDRLTPSRWAILQHGVALRDLSHGLSARLMPERRHLPGRSRGLAYHFVDNGYGQAGSSGWPLSPGGQRLEWRTLRIREPQLAGAPFFIQWADLSYHPARTSPEAGRLRSVQIMSPDSAELGRLLGGLGLRRVEVRQADELSMILLLEGGEGGIAIPQQ